MKINKHLIILLLIILFNFFIKLFLTIPFPEPVIYGDEFLYKESARYLFELTGKKIHPFLAHFTFEYGPIYPLMLSFSFLAKDNYYFWMKITNVILSTLIIIPVWLISCLYLSKKNSLYPTIVSALLPFHFGFPKYIMSENLFYPVFLFTIYFFLKTRTKSSLIKSILTGIFISFCILTRYFASFLLPLLLITWWLPPNNRLEYLNIKNKKLSTKIIHFFIILISSLVILIPWLKSDSNSFFKMSSDYLKGNINSGQYLVGNFSQSFIWFLLYLCYFILIISPFLTLILWQLVTMHKKAFRTKQNSFFILISGITLAFLIMATRHSSFNPTIDSYICGRYLIYLGILWIIYAFINASQIASLKMNSKKINSLKTATFISIFLIIISYLAIIKGPFWKIPSWFIMDHISPDVFIFKTQTSFILKGGILVLSYVCLINLILVLIAQKKPKNLSFIMFIMVAFFYFISDYKIQQTTLSKEKKNIITGKDIYLVLKEKYSNLDKITIYYNNLNITDSHLKYSLQFFGADERNFSIINLKDLKDINQIKERGLLLTAKNLGNTTKLKNLYGKYFIYELPIK